MTKPVPVVYVSVEGYVDDFDDTVVNVSVTGYTLADGTACEDEFSGELYRDDVHPDDRAAFATLDEGDDFTLRVTESWLNEYI